MTSTPAIAVLGAGHLGRFHAQVLHRLLQTQPVWIVDIDGERAAAVADQVGARATTDARVALAEVDAVVVATPTETHATVAGEAIGAGCHVLVEKPLTATLAAAEELIAQAAAAGRVLQVGHVERFNPIFQALQGEIGVPAYVEAERLAPFVPRSLDVDIVLDLMIHDLDLLLHLVPAEVESIDAVGVPVLTPREDIATARLRFANGTVADLTASRISQEKARKIRFFARQAYYSLDLMQRKARRVRVVAREDGALEVPGVGRFAVDEEQLAHADPDPLTGEWQAFLAAVAGRPSAGVTGPEALRVLRTAMEIRDRVRESRERLVSGGLGPAHAAGGPRGTGGPDGTE
ncbi:MAG: Gfo/Idh/MocA family oxidoreductase [Candidatus Eisenbacteria sp.]|nr:Gfo/Idh/MocA family oxidoreductase [Candidatus Eisenbacteria bacterium]